MRLPFTVLRPISYNTENDSMPEEIMNFQNINYFLATATERSFTKAAEKLHVTQQTLSGQIAALERELGFRLFVRHVPLELTEEGKAFERYAISFHRNYRAMVNEFADRAKEQRGTLRIGIAMTRGRIVLPRLIERFEEAYPLVSLEIQEDTNEALKNSLLAGNLDLMIGDLSEHIPGVQTKVFYEEEVVLLLPRVLLHKLYGKNYQSQLEKVFAEEDLHALADCPFLLGYPNDIMGRIAENLLRRSDLIPLVKCRSHNIEMLLDCCAQGQGACFSPSAIYQATLSPAQRKDLEILHFSSGTTYAIRFGWKEENAQWKLLQRFVTIASRDKG